MIGSSSMLQDGSRDTPRNKRREMEQRIINDIDSMRHVYQEGHERVGEEVTSEQL